MTRTLLAVIVWTACTSAVESCPRRCRWNMRSPRAWHVPSPRPVFSPPQAEEVVFLTTRLSPEKPFYQVITTKTVQHMNVQQMDVSQTQTSHFVVRWVPKKRDAKGRWTLGFQVLASRLDIDIGGNKIMYDSDDQTPNPLSNYFKLLLDTEFLVVLDTDFAVKSVSIQDFWRKNEVTDALLKAVMNEGTIRRLADPVFRSLPNRAVPMGTTWTQKRMLDLDVLGSALSDDRLRYVGVDHHVLDRIEVTSKMKHVPPMAKAGQPFRVVKTDVKSTSAGGTFWFDRGLGRVVKGESSFKLEGTIVLDISGLTTVVKLVQEQRTTINSMDRDPRAK